MMVGAHQIEWIGIPYHLQDPETRAQRLAIIRKNLITRFKKSVTELDPATSQTDLDRIWEGRCQITASWLSTILTRNILVQPSERNGQITLWAEDQDFLSSTWIKRIRSLVKETFSRIHQHNDLNQSEVEAFVLKQELRIRDIWR